MVRIAFFRKDGKLTGIECSGHSGYSHKGSDIICAAVSALMNALILGLNDVAEVSDAHYEIDAESALMKITWPVHEAGRLEVLTHTIRDSLIRIAQDNPRYAKIQEASNS